MNDAELARLLDGVWTHLTRGKADRRHPARHPVLATVGADGPDLRTLVLRAVDRDAARLEFHTDTASPKVAQIEADPRIAAHVWVPNARLQIRARGSARIEAGDDALFASLPPEARANYTGPIPGTPLADVTDTPTAPRFARLICTLTEIDALVLDDPHRRARFAATGGWRGLRIAP